MSDDFVQQLDNVVARNSEETLFAQYERVIMQSIITSFGLDFFVETQYGGDVDTVHNVRQIGTDSEMKYKNSRNESAWNSKPAYDSASYHSGNNFKRTKFKTKTAYRNGQSLTDDYTGKNIGFHGHDDGVSSEMRAELDHIISAKEIDNDRGRVLAEQSGLELADDTSNFAWTNKHLNASKRELSAKEYIQAHPELDEETKRRMRAKDKAARAEYDRKINVAYYTSSKFFKDTSKAAAKQSFEVGVRQVLGLVFTEIWMSVRANFSARSGGVGELFNSIARGVREGLNNAKKKHAELWHKFIEGSLSGALSSITTTLCNIFFTTAKNLVRIIRNSWSYLVEAAKVLFFNPDDLPTGEVFRAAAKILATGASVVLGSVVGEMLSNTGVGAIPIWGNVLVAFSTLLVSGIMSCSLLYLLDHSARLGKLIEYLNSLPTIDNALAQQRRLARLLDEYSSKVLEIDLKRFKRETNTFIQATSDLRQADVKDQVALERALDKTIDTLDLPSPYGKHDDFDSFMDDPDSVLHFS